MDDIVEWSVTLDEAGCARHRQFDSLQAARHEAKTLSREYATFVSVHMNGIQHSQYYKGKQRK